MAGDWIKFEVNTPEKQEVLAITANMGWDDPDLAVGKLLRVWRWFDQQTVDGNARSVSTALLDRIAGVTGFAKAMAEVGWLFITDEGIRLPNFERHNGKTAKDRALTAKRVANHKANAKSNDDGNAGTVTDALPREEKRREEKKETDSDFNFDQFWKQYPNKVAKANALKAWKKIKPDSSLLAKILESLEVAKSSDGWKKDGGRFIPHPTTWLNGKRWEDEVGGAAPDEEILDPRAKAPPSWFKLPPGAKWTPGKGVTW